jgi:hypothetical protein
MKALTDQDPMPFGTHSGKPMEKVPASYLLWLWEDGLWQLDNACTPRNISRLVVRDYIKRNFNALETECPDKIITRRPRPEAK